MVRITTETIGAAQRTAQALADYYGRQYFILANVDDNDRDDAGYRVVRKAGHGSIVQTVNPRTWGNTGATAAPR